MTSRLCLPRQLSLPHTTGSWSGLSLHLSVRRPRRCLPSSLYPFPNFPVAFFLPVCHNPFPQPPHGRKAGGDRLPTQLPAAEEPHHGRSCFRCWSSWSAWPWSRRYGDRPSWTNRHSQAGRLPPPNPRAIHRTRERESSRHRMRERGSSSTKVGSPRGPSRTRCVPSSPLFG